MGMAALFPSVQAFRQVCFVDIISAPPEFYASADLVCEEAYRRYRISLGQRRLARFLIEKTNADAHNIIASFFKNAPQPGV